MPSMNVQRDATFDNEEYAFGVPCYPNIPNLGDDREYRLVIAKREFMGVTHYNVAVKISAGDMFPKPVLDSYIKEPVEGATDFLTLDGGISSVFDSYDDAAKMYALVVKEMQSSIERVKSAFGSLGVREMMCKECSITHRWSGSEYGMEAHSPRVIEGHTKVMPLNIYDECLCVKHIL